MNQLTINDVMQADEARYQALFSRNFEVLSKILHREYVHTHANGKIDDKSTFIETLLADKYRFLAAERTEQRVRKFGAVVLLDGKVATTISVGGEEKIIRNAFLTVWNVPAHEWELLHWQATKLPDA